MSDTPPARIDYVCARCDGNAVTRDAWAEWSRGQQRWVVSEIFDFAFCHRCHQQALLEPRAIG